VIRRVAATGSWITNFFCVFLCVLSNILDYFLQHFAILSVLSFPFLRFGNLYFFGRMDFFPLANCQRESPTWAAENKALRVWFQEHRSGGSGEGGGEEGGQILELRREF
jgi:hypothetical protein